MKAIVPIKAKHVLNTHFADCFDCALARAIKEHFKVETVSVDVNEGDSDYHKFYFTYRHEDYIVDKVKAETSPDGEAVIRELPINVVLK